MLKPRLRIIQNDCVLANFNRNLEEHVRLAEEALEEGINAIAFPELSLTGYNVQDAAQDIAIHIDDPALDPLRELSRDITIICGGIELSDDYGVYNSAFFFEDGTGRSAHRKIYLPTYGMFEEHRYFSAGQRIEPLTSKRLGRIGIAICEDFWHVSVPYLLAHQGAKLLFVLLSSPLRLTPGEQEPLIVRQWQQIMNTYAFLFSTHVAAVNRIGSEDSFTFWGRSGLTGPDGISTAAAPLFKASKLDTEIDLQAVKQARLNSSHFLDEDMRLFSSELDAITSWRPPA
ncbi:MAG: nitrilase-related carbon-nitrogen hydrolase [Prosthecochloris sp.]|nr:nitrilase-related carbon-nitrogen hydrolase [Prosthecochloris sp.]